MNTFSPEDPAEKELRLESEAGYLAAQGLAAHLQRMGAGGCQIPVTFGGRSYDVAIKRLPDPAEPARDEAAGPAAESCACPSIGVLQRAADAAIHNAGIQLREGRNAEALASITEAESCLLAIATLSR